MPMVTYWQHDWDTNRIQEFLGDISLGREVRAMRDLLARVTAWALHHMNWVWITDALITLWIWLTQDDLGGAVLSLLVLMVLDFILGAIIVPFSSHTPHKFSSRILFTKAFSKIVLYSILIATFVAGGHALKSFVHNGYVQMIIDFISVGFVFAVLILFEIGSILEHLKTLGYTVRVGRWDLTGYLLDKIDQSLKTLHDRQPNSYYYDIPIEDEDLEDMNP